MKIRTKFAAFLVAAAFLAVLFWSHLVLAQSPPCMDRSEVMTYFSERYQESLVGDGVIAGIYQQSELELLSTATGSTWTILITENGRSCIVATGRHLRLQQIPKIRREKL